MKTEREKIIKTWLNGRPETTQENYERGMSKFCKFAKTTPDAIIKMCENKESRNELFAKIREFNKDMEQKGIAQNSRRMYVASLRNFLRNIAEVQLEIIRKAIPLEGYRNVKEKAIVRAEDLAKMLPYCNPKEKALLLTQFSSG